MTERKGFIHRTWAFGVSIPMCVYDLAIKLFQIKSQLFVGFFLNM